MYESRFAELFGPPPPSPPVPIDWAVTESRLGLRLPADYKAIASAYGPVDIGDRIWLHIPCTQPEGFDYGAWLREQHRWARISSRGAPPYEPPPFHPVPGGLLAWGSTRGTDLLFWDTSVSDDPDAWPVVVFCVDAMRAGVDPWRNFGMPLLETLAAAREGLDLPGGGRLGPLGRRVRRADLLLEAQPWTPPVPKPPRVPEHLQRTALAEGSGLETLRLLVPPPEQPVLGDGEWEQLFVDLGTRLPEEYLAIMNLYGAGLWSEWLQFEPPFGRHQNFLAFAGERIEGYCELRDDYPESFPLATWPEPGGYLPFAESIDGDGLGWLTVGEPGDWPLIVHPRHMDQGPPLECGLADLLLGWLRGRPAAVEFPHLDPLDDPLEFAEFRPWPGKAKR